MKNKSYVEFSTLYNNKLYSAICGQIENGAFTAEFTKDNTTGPFSFGAVLSGKVKTTCWELSIIINPYSETSLSIYSENATPYVTTANGKTFELLPQDNYDGCRVINTDQLGNGGGTFGTYLLDLVNEYLGK